jgi:hypothetical protein
LLAAGTLQAVAGLDHPGPVRTALEPTWAVPPGSFVHAVSVTWQSCLITNADAECGFMLCFFPTKRGNRILQWGSMFSDTGGTLRDDTIWTSEIVLNVKPIFHGLRLARQSALSKTTGFGIADYALS